MPSLSRDLAEHKLPIQEWRKHVKQSPKRFSPNVMEAIKA